MRTQCLDGVKKELEIKKQHDSFCQDSRKTGRKWGKLTCLELHLLVMKSRTTGICSQASSCGEWVNDTISPNWFLQPHGLQILQLRKAALPDPVWSLLHQPSSVNFHRHLPEPLGEHFGAGLWGKHRVLSLLLRRDFSSCTPSKPRWLIKSGSINHASDTQNNTPLPKQKCNRNS